MIKPFFDRRVEKRRFSGAKPRLFKEVYRKMAKSDGQFILVKVEFCTFLPEDFVLRRFKKFLHSGAMELFFEEV